MTDLSVIIPSRNEIFLKQTIEDILKNKRGDTEVIAVLDGAWADPPIEDDPQVTLVYMPEPIGQRAACNVAAKIARGKYILKSDAHCAFAEGFDLVLMEDIQADWTIVPTMRNLHTFDWVCKDGHRRYQGPSGPCRECGEPTFMEIVWIAKNSPQSTAYCFDSEPHFQYMNDFKKRPEGQGDLTETMSLQGSCWMLTREKYFELNVCDEEWGTWGSQGIEVAAKTWLSGGRVVCDQRTWYAHQFRTQGGDFGFPYPLSGKQVEHAKKTAHRLFFENRWDKQLRPLSWLVERFWPVKGWSEEDLERQKENDKIFNEKRSREAEAETEERADAERSRVATGLRDTRIEPAYRQARSNRKGIIYYSDCQLDPTILSACQKQLVKSVNGTPIVSATLKKMDFGAQNIHFPSFKRGPLAMFNQIRAGLEHSTADYVFFCEHDVLYHPSHFEFVPERDDIVYYNINVWKVRYPDGHAVHYDCQQTSGICANRLLLLKHYNTRIEKTEKAWKEMGGDTAEFRRFIRDQGYEPGTHHRAARVDDLKSESWQSTYPNIDIRHDTNLTPSRWSQDQFRSARSCKNWQEADEVPGWGRTKDRFDEFLSELWPPLHIA